PAPRPPAPRPRGPTWATPATTSQPHPRKTLPLGKTRRRESLSAAPARKKAFHSCPSSSSSPVRRCVRGSDRRQIPQGHPGPASCLTPPRVLCYRRGWRPTEKPAMNVPALRPCPPRAVVLLLLLVAAPLAVASDPADG